MSVRPSSPIFERLRGADVEGALVDEQLAAILEYAERSPILMRRLTEFETAQGCILFNTDSVNCYWRDRQKDPIGPPSIYLATEYRNTGAFAGQLGVVTQLIAHELSHFETDFSTEGGFNTNNMENKEIAAVAGVRDEARAYALEYLVQAEINRTHPKLSGLVPEQEAAARAAVEAVPPDEREELRMLDAATIALLDWSANWTGPDTSAGGYFQFYQNEWLKVRKMGSVARRNVRFACDSEGRVMKVSYDTVTEGEAVAIIDPRIGAFAPPTQLA